MPLIYRTTIVVYTDFDTRGMDIDAIAREAMDGDAICTGQVCDKVQELSAVPAEALSFFKEEEEE